jgi:hypothetical protein
MSEDVFIPCLLLFQMLQEMRAATSADAKATQVTVDAINRIKDTQVELPTILNSM